MKKVQINSPAGNLKCLKAAVDNGADSVYFGFRSASNLRNFQGINFTFNDAKQGVEYAHERGTRVFITINSYPQAQELKDCFKAVDDAYSLGADEIIISDLAVLDYAKNKFPDLAIHLSVQAGVSNLETIKFYEEQFRIKAVCLPRVLTTEEISEIASLTEVKIEVFAMGSLCINYEGKCFLSPYVTGESTNTIGTCSTPKFLTFEDRACRQAGNGNLAFKMNGITLNKYQADELPNRPQILKDGYREEDVHKQWVDDFLINRRQICKGRYFNCDVKKSDYALNSIVWLNCVGIIGNLVEAGVRAFKIEGRQRSADYVGKATRIFRKAVDAYYNGSEDQDLTEEWKTELNTLFEGLEPTVNCYLKKD